MRTRNLANAAANNAEEIKSLHPDERERFSNFVFDCEQSGTPVWIFSAYRTVAEQASLYRKYLSKESKIVAAKPGSSYHNYGLAIDIYVYDFVKEEFVKDRSLYRKIQPIANKYKLRWLGSTMKGEIHHFDYNNIKTIDLLKAHNKGLVDENGYVLLDEVDKKSVKETVLKVLGEWETKVGGNLIKETQTETEKKEKPIRRMITKIENQNAVGIWQIIKMVADQYSLSQSVNDAGIATSQGSLINFVNQVVQAPWLQFYGDTIGDQYYFFSRKEPFDYNGWTELPLMTSIYEEEVLTDDLAWYDGEVFSWYQIIPRGSFLGEQNLIFAYITAVFFEEYAEIWGSKPNIQVSNYVNFTKVKGQSSMYKKAKEDLRYMVESNMYLPFTRQGTITVRGTTRIKRGYKIFYHPTGEEFYVDSVSTRYSANDGGAEFITIIQVSRGMKIEFTAAPKNKDSIGYFNLILFDENVDNAEDINWKVNDKVFQFFINRKQFAKE